MRLHYKIWLAFMLIVAVAAPVSFLIGHLAGFRGHPSDYARIVSGIIVEDVAALEEPKRAARMRQIGAALKVELGLFGPQGDLVAATPRAPALPADRREEGTIFRHGPGMAAVFRTSNGYWITVAHSGGEKHKGLPRFILTMAVFSGVLFAGAYFISRRLASQLERLQNSVAAWDGRSAPAPIAVEGSGEVARLAESFNAAGERITRLLDQQRALLANTSHELRTPLTRIRMAAQMMADNPDANKRMATLAAIDGDIKEMDALVEDILTAARLDANPVDRETMEPLDLAALAREAAEPFGVEVHGPRTMASGSRTLLKRMIANLLENARKHAPAKPAMVEVGMEGDFAALRVTDFGPGLGEGEHQRVFDPFFRGKGAGPQGHGLGLSIVKKIAQRHGGQATCSAREGGGTVFTIHLPGMAAKSPA